MKQIFFIFTFILTTNFLQACLSASQNRLFPLGQTSKGLCVVETHLYRTEFREKGKEIIEMKPAWIGMSYFKIYDNLHKEIHSEVIDSIALFQQYQYDSIITISFNKGLLLASRHSDFIAANPISITFCDYQEKCSKAQILFDTKNNKVRVQLSNKIKYDITVLFDTASIASNMMDYYRHFDDFALTAKSFKKALYINSVRQFQIGNKKLTVLHIGKGQTFELSEGGTYPPGKEYKADFHFNDITKTVFNEPVLHHGHGFDFFIWE